MLNFIMAAAGLFTHIWDAAMQLEIFRFLGGWMMFLGCLSLFYLAYNTTRRM